ncbi:MAG: hypothetical protein JOZ19_13015 [Rubrobacter sp.]|nr:hypothetical protein [Rubrobacter sp.]
MGSILRLYARLCRAIERSNFESLVSFYAEDAELLTVNRNATPSSPEVLSGKEAIAERLEDVCSRAMTHRVEYEVLKGPHSVPRGVRVPGRWDPGSRCEYARCARWSDGPAGKCRGLGRINQP